MELSRRSLLTTALAAAAAPALGAGPAAAATRTATRTRVPTAASAARVTQIVDGMSLRERVGQLIAAGVPFGDLGTARSLARDYHIGTIFWSGRSSGGVATLSRWDADVQDYYASNAHNGTQEFTAVDQEGGYVQSLRGSGVSDIPTALAQARQSTSTIEYRAALWGRQLRRAGITLDLAPVAGVVPPGYADHNPPIGHYDRQFGSTPQAVQRAVAPWVRGMLSAGVQPTLKHFPGLGLVGQNTDTHSHVVDPVTTRSAATLAPWRTGIAAGAGVVMVSNAIYAKIDPHGQAFLSPAVVTGMIRHDMGFGGVVMTDDVGRAAAVQDVPLRDRATRFVLAGGDLVLNVVPDQIPQVRNALYDAAARNRGFAARVRQSAIRVVALKARTGLAR